MIAAFIDYSRTECHLSANTVAAYRRDLVKFQRWVGVRPLQRLTIQELAEFVAYLGEAQLAPRKHRAASRVAETFFSLPATRRGAKGKLSGTTRQPETLGARAESSEPRPNRRRCSRPRLCKTIVTAATGRCSNCSMPPAAARVEVSFMRLSDLHLKEGYATCRGKGNKERIVPLGQRAIECVQHYIEHERAALAAQFPDSQSWLLLTRRGLRIAASGYGNW